MVTGKGVAEGFLAAHEIEATAREGLRAMAVDGRRVLVLGESGQQLTTLSEITDADEISALIGQLRGSESRVFEAVPTIANEGLTVLWPDLDRLAESENAELALHAREAAARLAEEMDRGS